jgi:hypothetical protein
LAQYKSSDSIKPEKPADRIDSVELNLGSLSIFENADETIMSCKLDEFLDLMQVWEGQTQDCTFKAMAPKSNRKRSSKKA